MAGVPSCAEVSASVICPRRSSRLELKTKQAGQEDRNMSNDRGNHKSGNPATPANPNGPGTPATPATPPQNPGKRPPNRPNPGGGRQVG